jgi:class 3 adenylate cyclase
MLARTPERCHHDAERNAGIPVDEQVESPVGINLGDVIVEGTDIFGDGANIAARLGALADPAGIGVSRIARDQVCAAQLPRQAPGFATAQRLDHGDSALAVQPTAAANRFGATRARKW